MANGTKTPQDEEYYNRTQDLYNRELSGNTTAQQDQRDAFENDFGGDNYQKDAPTSGSDILAQKARDKEQNPEAPIDNGLYNPSGKTKQKYTGKLAGLRKKGPLTGIIALLFGGALGIGGLFGGPSLLLVNVSEVLQGKFNTAITSLDNRANKIIVLKVKGTVSGICSSRISIGCKYKSLSADEIRGMQQEGIDFTDSGGNTLNPDDIESGKVRPAKMIFNNTEIKPADFPKTYATNPTFRSAMQNGIKFNARYASVGGKIWQKVKTNLRISKRDPFADEKPNATDEDRLKTVEDETKNGVADETIAADPNSISDDDSRCAKNPCTEAEKQKLATADASSVNELADASKNPTSAVDSLQEADSLTAEAGTAGGQVAVNVAEKVGNALKVTGWLDDACSVKRTIRGVGDAAKMVRYAQLARYAMVFLTTADMIKAGDAKPGDVNYLSNTLMKTTIQTVNGKQTTTPTATDTLAYRNAAFGDTGTLDTVATSYLTAGGLTGVLIGVDNTINTILGGNANNTCKTLANPFVGGASLLAGIALMIIPGGQFAMGAKDAAQVGVAAALIAAEIVLPSLLQNIVAGTIVDKNTYGAAAGDALVSGTGALFSTNAQYSGNAPLTPSQAVAYTGMQNQTLAQYAAQDQLAYSPLDATNPNTFAGTIVTQLTRYAGSFSSIGTSLSAMSSIVTSSFGAIFSPLTHADANNVAQYQTCQDEDYQNLGVATDLFCNVIRGIPVQYLNAAPAPDVLYQQMVDNNQANEDGSAVSGSAYDTILNQCINRDQSKAPLGNDVGGSDGSECIINDQTTANYYIYYIDQNALDQMENGMTQTGGIS